MHPINCPRCLFDCLLEGTEKAELRLPIRHNGDKFVTNKVGRGRLGQLLAARAERVSG